mgnify:CR=1 FL=1
MFFIQERLLFALGPVAEESFTSSLDVTTLLSFSFLLGVLLATSGRERKTCKSVHDPWILYNGSIKRTMSDAELGV